MASPASIPASDPSPQEPGEKHRGELPIGSLLELARKRAGLSVSAAAWVLKIDEYALVRYESGVRTPTKSLLEDFSHLYEVDFEGKQSVHEGQLLLGWAEIDLSECTDNECRLRRIASTLRSIRRVDFDVPLVVRTEEIPLLAAALDLEDPQLAQRLEEWLALPEPEASQLVERLCGLTE